MWARGVRVDVLLARARARSLFFLSPAPPPPSLTHSNARTQRSDVGCRPLQPPQWWLRLSRVLLILPVPVKRPPSTRPNRPQGLFCKLYARMHANTTHTQHTKTHNTDALVHVHACMCMVLARVHVCIYTHSNIYVYIYIYREREREREIDRYVMLFVSMVQQTAAQRGEHVNGRDSEDGVGQTHPVAKFWRHYLLRVVCVCVCVMWEIFQVVMWEIFQSV